MNRLEFNNLFGGFLDATSIELPSKIFYRYLEFFNEKYKHYEECKSKDSLHKTDSKTIRICEKLVNYLKNNYEQENKGDLKDHHCNLLSHWLYEQLDRKFEENSLTLISIYGNLKLILSKVLKEPKESQANECLREVTVFFPFKNWKDRKDLYDYCVDYDKIMQLAGSSYEKCKKYEEYIKNKTPHYEKFDELYIRQYVNENKNFYDKCKSYHPERVLPTLKCHENFPNEAREKAGSHGPGLLESIPSSGKNSDSTNTYGNVLLGVVVTSMTSGMLYKFTPLGRRLRNRYGWNNYAAGNLNVEGNMLFAQTHDPFSPLSEEREHHIGYLPA